MTTATLLFATAMLQAPKLDKDTARLFAWFDSLGSQQYISKPFVGVLRSYGRPEWPLADSGFLLNEDEKQFTILNLDHAVVSYRKIWRDNFNQDYEIVPLNFKGALNRKLSDFRKGEPIASHPLVGDDASIAWWCWKLGHFKESRRLMVPHIQEIAELNQDPETTDSVWSDFLKSVQRCIVNTVGEKALAMIEDDTYSRQELLSKFEGLVRQFGDTPLGDDLKDIRDRLRSMMEPENLVAPTGDTVEAKLRRLLWELQEDRHIAFNRMDSEILPQIVKLGSAVIPDLIEAIADKRLTRSVSRGIKGPLPLFRADRVHTVGDGALRALEQIAGRRFWNGDKNQIQRLARRWYLAKMNRGEEGVLSDSVLNADACGTESAEQLVAKYPGDAFRTIRAGFELAQGFATRASLLVCLESLDDPKRIDFLRFIALTDKSQQVRAGALRAIFPADPTFAISRYRHEIEHPNDKYDPQIVMDVLVASVVLSGDAESVRWLQKRISTWSPRVKEAALKFHISTGAKLKDFPSRMDATTEKGRQYRLALEDFLASALTPKSSWTSHSKSPKSEFYSGWAVTALEREFPEVYGFDVALTPERLMARREAVLAIYLDRLAKRQ